MNFGMPKTCRFLLFALLYVAGSRVVSALPWYPFGPDGGDARAFAQDPSDHTHLYLGTTNGWLYQTHDNGVTWIRVTKIAQRDDLVLDHILVDPADSRHLLVGAHSVSPDPSRNDGGIFVSHDGGSTWATVVQMQGQSIRSMTATPSSWRVVLAGSLQGVYRSTDGGDHWMRISPTEPPLSNEIHNVQSLAVDPHDPNIIYAGTWHLPWKTVDGGKTWENMKQGIIDDSDVFSIIVDPKKPSTVYLSACSGIYKSENTGTSFVKAQGIPSDARRTRVLHQDPQDLDTVFAGTTLGLYRSTDAGSHWQLMMGDSTLIVNDVYVDPTNPRHVLLATDHGGVLVSDDGGILFRHSNNGFTQRQIVAYASDPHHQATIYLGVVNDKQDGGVFKSPDGGRNWTQMSDGLAGRDVLSLAGAPDGTMVAGTEHGIFRLAGAVWVPSGRSDVSTLQGSAAAPPSKAVPKTAAARRRVMAARAAVATPKAPVSQELDDRIFALATAGNSMYAATSTGLLWSGSAGESWRHISDVPAGEWRFVATNKSTVLAGQLKALTLSTDDGSTWKSIVMPQELKQIAALAVDGAGELWVSGRQGVFYSADGGINWRTVKYLEVNEVTSLFYDAGGNRILLTADSSPTWAFVIGAGDKVVTPSDTGWHVQMLRPVENPGGNFLVGVSRIDGIIVQSPVWVDSATLPARK